MPITAAYYPTLWAMGATGFLLLVQIGVADIISIRSKHKPGFPVPADSKNTLFRASRAYANTNETIGAFILFAGAGILASADAGWLNGCAWLYVVSRFLHMFCYYANLSLPRSLAFGTSIIALLGMGITLSSGLTAPQLPQDAPVVQPHHTR